MYQVCLYLTKWIKEDVKKKKRSYKKNQKKDTRKQKFTNKRTYRQTGIHVSTDGGQGPSLNESCKIKQL